MPCISLCTLGFSRLFGDMGIKVFLCATLSPDHGEVLVFACLYSSAPRHPCGIQLIVIYVTLPKKYGFKGNIRIRFPKPAKDIH